MKKIIFAALSVLMMLSLVGCGEHLVDFKVIDLSSGAVPGDWAIPANWDNTTPFTSVDKDNNTYTFEFTVKDDLAEGAEVGFKILTVNGDWNVAGYTEFEVTVDGEAATADYKDNCGPAGNAFVKGCEAGKTYKMTVVCNSDSTATVSVVSMEDPVYPTPYYLDGFFLMGGFLGDSGVWSPNPDYLLTVPTVDKVTGSVVYKLDFTAKKAGDYFCIAKKSDNSRWHGTPTVNGDYVEFEYTTDGMKSSSMTGFTPDSKYRIYVKTTPDEKVSVKVVALTPVTLSGATVTVTGLPEALNGTTLYFTGSFNDWKKPGEDGSIPALVTDGEITIALPEFSNDFEGSEPQEFALEGKFANTNWTKPEIGVAEGNIKFTLTPEKYSLKGTYKSVDGEIYICDWVVE